MSKVEYHAGFFDGEGSIGIYKNGSSVWHLRTQVTQNISVESTLLFEELRSLYGGNLAQMKSAIYQRGAAYNWQLNGANAVAFLDIIRPHLRLKAEQADIATAWYALSMKPSRDARGRQVAYERDRPIDIGAARLMKALKRQSIDAVMAAQVDLVEVAHTLKQVVCVKG